jgi:hypothetical protein
MEYHNRHESSKHLPALNLAGQRHSDQAESTLQHPLQPFFGAVLLESLRHFQEIGFSVFQRFHFLLDNPYTETLSRNFEQNL